MRRLALSVLSLAFLAACQPATTELTEEQKAAIVDEITRLRAAYADRCAVGRELGSEPLRDYLPFQESMRPKG